MAVAANTITTATQVGQRESLADKRFMIEPKETPFITAIGEGERITNYYSEWLPVALNAANKDNAGIDGDDAPANSAQTPGSRVGNRAQLFYKIASVAEGANQLDIAAQNNKMKTELADKAIELRRDMEAAFLSNNPSVTMTGSVAGKVGGMQAILTSNVSRGAGGANGGFTGGQVTAATGGTDRALTYAMITTVMQSRFTYSGNPRADLLAFMAPSVKSTYWSTFTGLSVNRVENMKTRLGAEIVASVDVILTDFGRLAAIPHPYAFASGEKPVIIVDPSQLSYRTIAGIQQEKLAKNGFADRQKLTCFATLQYGNEKAQAIVTDIL